MELKRWMSFALLTLLITACSAEVAAPTPALLPLPSATSSPAVIIPAATPVIIATPAPVPTPVTYLVQKGDTLVGIAVKYGVSVEALQAANHDVQPQFLSIGALLVIPSPAGEPVVNPANVPTPVPVTLDEPACYPTVTGALYCFVEARNPGGMPVENVSANITLAGADGLPLASGVAHPALDVIPPGAAAPLAVFFSPAPIGVAVTGVSLLSASTVLSAQSPARRFPLEIPSHSGSASGAQWTAAGQVRNPSPTSAAAAWLVLTLYDASGRIVGYRKESLAGGLAAGATASFSISAASLGGAVHHYIVAAEGRP